MKDISTRMRVTKRQLRRIIQEAVNDRALRDTAEKEALRAFRETDVGRMTRNAWVTSVRQSPLEPEFETDAVFRATIRTDGGDKRQWDIVLDSETGSYRGSGEVARY